MSHFDDDEAYWFTLRKGVTSVHVTYDVGQARLYAENIRGRADKTYDISIDLNKSLRGRGNRGMNMDARGLARGKIKTLKTLQIFEKQVIKNIESAVEAMDEPPEACRLHLNLAGSHWFLVSPKVQGNCLWLTVESALDLPDSDAPRD